ncbi:alpha/beta hydrolase [Chryseobacterium sp. SNU WT5]|uniref:alpha/beta hydrolase n=1 Tax=Chryseobacterium sp. SNU WT5 TaxID=2594269 RepID=UPI00117FDA04|nr:alpha/beta hydrolase [Chryseobacterium sp. SNU WT5]QDP84182.1 alpha/beta hydrolase [Chryseobacterium sp. SNU WT5]
MSKIKILSLFLYSLMLVSCQSKRVAADGGKYNYHFILTKYVDSTRDRLIPVAIYQPVNLKVGNITPIIFSHGYGGNKGDDYAVDYTYLLEALAEKGYFIISIQHELKNDDLLPMDEPFKTTRMPNWQRGAENIGFVLNKIKTEFPSLNYNKLAVIGHSNGGDMSVLFAHQHPELINKLISMDNRRMDLPRTSKPKIYTLRSNDYPADEGVLPTDEEKEKFGITVQFTDINHSSMDNDANNEERKYLISKIVEYLHEK